MFLVLAPLIVFYVRGMNFDFKKGQFVQTGILALKAEPKDAKVFLDGKLVSETAKDIKFLVEKQYDIKLEKPGYESWQKRLEVTAGKVTWASPPSGKIILFLKQTAPENLASNVSDFILDETNGRIIFLSNNSLMLAPLTNPKNSETLTLPKAADNLIPSPDFQKLVAETATGTKKSALLIDLKSKEAADISALFTGTTNWLFDNDNKLYAINQNKLYVIDPKNISKTLLASDIKAAIFLDHDLYLLKQKSQTLSFQITSNPAKEPQDILTELPLFSQSAIVVSFEKQAYILGDGTLYKVGSKLEPLATGVTIWNENFGDSSLTVFHESELDYVNPYNHSLELITRRESGISLPILQFFMGSSFFVENNKVKTIELDTRDRQNEYNLYTGQNIKKIALTGDAKKLLVLDSGELKLTVIR